MTQIVTGSTLSKNLAYFIRDVLRNNLTDPNSSRSDDEWIFKSGREDTIDETEFPRIIVDEESITWNSKTWGTKGNYDELPVTMLVVHDNPLERDTITDSIRDTLTNEDSQDEDGNTIKEQHLRFLRITTDTDDGYINYPTMLRRKNVTVFFKYSGG